MTARPTAPPRSALVDSVIVPTYNEAASLPLLVERLAPAMRDRDWELIVVDDGSPDGTAEVGARGLGDRTHVQRGGVAPIARRAARAGDARPGLGADRRR